MGQGDAENRKNVNVWWGSEFFFSLCTNHFLAISSFFFFFVSFSLFLSKSFPLGGGWGRRGFYSRFLALSLLFLSEKMTGS